MSIGKESELEGMQAVSNAVATTLKEMRAYAKPGMSAKELDDFGGQLLKDLGAQSAPHLAYRFPGYTCISINQEIAHGIPSANKILQEGDLVNVDVSAELNGFWADNGGSFVLGEDIHSHQALVDASKDILHKAVYHAKAGVRIAHIGKIIETEAKKRGFTVIRNLAGHGVGRSLHEEPSDILNCYDRFNRKRFKNNTTVAIETFIATKSSKALTQADGWTLVGNQGGFVAQHEHTIMITNNEPVILTATNGIWE
ncbi:type I methionyl aminopeptidase [uncultured Microscilla sp.]|uniref:type I methionyl aminopeptidase n=1 Tax=uncultured Microscilla sp. TaxID=432653 RepID=UPI002623B709|nr:type I methionyl aminopeptidase [uncultured Microscilla sp.]